MRPLILILPLALAACMPQPKKATSGAEDFASFCAACHGASGSGTSEIAANLAVQPADLTKLSKHNNGKFPGTAVMAKIWGVAGGSKDSHAVMPEFAALLDSDLVPYDGGDGIYTPTPRRLTQIAEYLKAIQG